MLTPPWKTHRCSLMQITLSQNLQKIVQIVEFVLCSESLNLNRRLLDNNSFFLITRKSKIKNRKLSSQCSFRLVRGQTIEVLISERVLYCGTTSIHIADQPFIPLVSSPTPPPRRSNSKSTLIKDKIPDREMCCLRLFCAHVQQTEHDYKLSVYRNYK